jgi:L-ascorbate metabolism protein UlaG (beta-lactamase superfamily)
MHWGTFQLTDEPMDEPVQLLRKLTKNLNYSDQFIALQHGETIKI